MKSTSFDVSRDGDDSKLRLKSCYQKRSEDSHEEITTHLPTSEVLWCSEKSTTWVADETNELILHNLLTTCHAGGVPGKRFSTPELHMSMQQAGCFFKVRRKLDEILERARVVSLLLQEVCP